MVGRVRRAPVIRGYHGTTGLPDATNDVGEWDEPLGLASMVVEGLVVCVGGAVIAARREATSNVAAGTSGAWSATLPRGASSS